MRRRTRLHCHNAASSCEDLHTFVRSGLFTSEYGIPCEPIPGTPEANDAETAIKSADLLAEALLTRCLASFLRDDKLYALGAGDLHAYAAAERTRQPLCSYLATLPIDVTRLVRTAAR